MNHRLTTCLGIALLGVGCMFNTSIHVHQPDGAPSFGRSEQDTAKAIVVEIGRAARFSQIDGSDAPSDHPSSPYRWFVSLSGRDSEQDTVEISAGMRKDDREIRVVVSDDVRGEPLPATQQMIDDLHTAFERAFPDCRVEVTTRKKPRLFGP